ncbi:hypothetical protein G6F56_003163 [Rhizopus delemar]|nr:hypothetical protein G6F56_003163 [Rhizopus delemar]
MPRIIGELVIVAYKARDLPNREIAGKQDPFVVFRLGENTRQTKTDYRGGQHPIWDDQVNMPIPEKKKQMLVQVYDEDAKRKDLISELDLDISKVLEDGEQDGWFPLHFKNRKAGDIYLEMTFYSAAPPPKRQPTRYGAKPKKQTSYTHPVPLAYPVHPAYQLSSANHVPSVTPRPYHYPHTSAQLPNTQPINAQTANTRPLPPAPTGIQSAHYPSQYPYARPSPYPTGYPPAVPAHNAPTVLQHPVNSRPASYAGPPTSGNHYNTSHASPIPTHTISTGSQHPANTRPISYTGQQIPVNHLSGPSPPPVPTPSAHTHLAVNASHAPLLSSPYNPGGNASVAPHHHNQGQPGGNYSSYPNNRHSYPQQGNSYHPPNNSQFQGNPHDRYPPTDSLGGTPFAAHQGSHYQTNAGNYPSRPYSQTGYPPQSNNGYPPY